MSILSKNLKLLRKESYLSFDEIVDKIGTTQEEFLKWEEGISEPNEIILEKVCQVLKMPYEDIRERDLTEERNDALNQMKAKKDRKNYDWYFGSKTEKLFYIGYIVYFIIGLTLAIVICNALQLRYGDYSGVMANYPDYTLEYVKLLLFIKDLIKCLTVFVIGCAIFIFIWVLKRYTIPIYWWYIWFISIIITALLVVSALGCIPFFVYSIVNIFKKKKL